MTGWGCISGEATIHSHGATVIPQPCNPTCVDIQCLVHPVADASQPAAAARRCGSGALPSYCRGMHSHSESATSGLPLDYKGNAHNSATFFPGGIRNCFSAPRATLPWPIIIYQRGGIPLSTTCASLRRPDDPFTSIRRVEA